MYNKTRNSLKISLFQIIVVAAAFIFIGRQLYLNWQQILSYKSHYYPLEYRFLIITILLFCLNAFFEPLVWAFILKLLNSPLSFIKSMKVYSVSTLARYIPGRIWNAVSLVYLGEKEGLLKYALAVSAGIETLFMLSTSIIIFALSLLFSSDTHRLGKAIWAVFLIPVFLILGWPSVLRAIVKLGSRVFKTQGVTINFNLYDSIKLLFFYGMLWIIYGAAMFSLARTIFPISPQLLPIFIGFFSISWTLSYLTFLTPAGLGVREGILVFLLSIYLPVAVAILISLLIRVCAIIFELARIATVLILEKSMANVAIPD